jgi:ABC-2 type transport system ATP-binding protein
MQNGLQPARICPRPTLIPSHPRIVQRSLLLKDPDILLLDEPASDLDPRARIEMRDLLTELQAMGKTIFLSSHILSELADLCTSVAIVDRGSLVVAGPIGEIRDRWRGTQRQPCPGTVQGPMPVTVRRLKLRVLGDSIRAKGLLLDSPVVHDVELHPQGHLIVTHHGEESEIASLARLLIVAGVELFSMEPERLELERFFLEVTRGELQ